MAEEDTLTTQEAVTTTAAEEAKEEAATTPVGEEESNKDKDTQGEPKPDITETNRNNETKSMEIETIQKEQEASKEQEHSTEKQSKIEGAPPALPPAPALVLAPAPAELPSTPTDRDVCIGDDNHKGTRLLIDLIRLHYLLLTKGGDKVPTDEKVMDSLASRLTQLVLNGKSFELSGLRDVPKSYWKGQGRIFAQKETGWAILGLDESTEKIKTILQEQFKAYDESESFPSSDLNDMAAQLFTNIASPKASDDPAPHSAPRPCDVLFLPIDYPHEENMPYDHQSGNKHLLFLASQHVAADTNDSTKRVDAAFRLVTSKVDVNSGTDLVSKIPRYVIQQLVDNQNSWKEMDYQDLCEFAQIFVFEVYLEKQIHGMDHGMAGGSVSSQLANLPLEDNSKPGTDPVDQPTEHDVLFGRGGMTNGWTGNRRFRDIIALHRPDYIRATKMDKPNVARRIVKAIRSGDPAGRFLKKGEDGRWYDVGDRCAAEKTSQGLRERSNAEKRQRAAQRDSAKFSKLDMEDVNALESTANKRSKVSLDPSGMGQLGLSSVVPTYVGAQMNYSGGIPLSVTMKEKHKEGKSKKGKKGKEDGTEDENQESLPPNATDAEGNILVTDYDILCGRGGLTNHHLGNKRFRDIVALHRPDYIRAPKIQKPSVARVIVKAIRNGEPPGRFLKNNSQTGQWYDIGDKKAAEKTSQALREKANEVKEEAPASSKPLTSPTLVLPAATPTETKTEDPMLKTEEKSEDKTDATTEKEADGIKKEDDGDKKGVDVDTTSDAVAVDKAGDEGDEMEVAAV